MSYYKPLWLAALSFLASALTACTYPIFGFIFANLAFVYLDPTAANFLHERNIWCGYLILYVFLVGFFAYM